MSATSRFRAEATLAADPAEVMALLTEPTAIAGWAPVPFELEGDVADRLAAGDVLRVSGGLAGRRVTFDVEVLQAGAGRLALTARGAVRLEVEYRVSAALDGGSEVRARIDLHRRPSPLGALLAGATAALLSGGVLQIALARMAAELDDVLLCA